MALAITKRNRLHFTGGPDNCKLKSLSKKKYDHISSSIKREIHIDWDQLLSIPPQCEHVDFSRSTAYYHSRPEGQIIFMLMLLVDKQYSDHL